MKKFLGFTKLASCESKYYECFFFIFSCLLRLSARGDFSVLGLFEDGVRSNLIPLFSYPLTKEMHSDNKLQSQYIIHKVLINYM